MAFTQDQHDRLEAAIAKGVLKVEYADKKVTYQSTTDMLRVLNLMKRDLGLVGNDGGRSVAGFSKGIYPGCSDFDRWID